MTPLTLNSHISLQEGVRKAAAFLRKVCRSVGESIRPRSFTRDSQHSHLGGNHSHISAGGHNRSPTRSFSPTGIMGEHTTSATTYAASVVQSLMSSVRDDAPRPGLGPGPGQGPGMSSVPHSHVTAGSFRGRGRDAMQGDGLGQGMLHVHVPSPNRATKGGYPGGSLQEGHHGGVGTGVGVGVNVSSASSLSNSPTQHPHQQVHQHQPASPLGNLTAQRGNSPDARTTNNNPDNNMDAFEFDSGLDNSNNGESYLTKQHFMPVAPPPVTYSTLTAATTSVTQAVLNMGEDEEGLHIGVDNDDDDYDQEGNRFVDHGYSKNKMLADHLRTMEGGANPVTAAAPELVGMFSMHSNNKTNSATTQEEDTPGFTTLHLQGMVLWYYYSQITHRSPFTALGLTPLSFSLLLTLSSHHPITTSFTQLHYPLSPSHHLSPSLSLSL